MALMMVWGKCIILKLGFGFIALQADNTFCAGLLEREREREKERQREREMLAPTCSYGNRHYISSRWWYSIFSGDKTVTARKK